MATNWINDLLGQRIFLDGTELLPTKKAWDFLGGLNASYNTATERVEITIGGGGFDWQESCRLASAAAFVATRVGDVLTANGNGNINTLGGIDGINTVVLADRVLMKDQATGADNGIFVLTDLGTVGTPWIMTRDILADATGEISPGMRVVIEEGTANGQLVYQCTNTGTVTMNSTAMTFATAGSLLALVTQVASGAVNATGATANAVYQAGAPTVGGAWTSYLSLGTTVATAGDARLHDTFAFNAWSGVGDVPVLSKNGADQLTIGSGSAAGAVPANLLLGSGADQVFYINGNEYFRVTAAAIEATAPIVRFDAATVTPFVTQAVDSGAGATADLMTWEAQGVDEVGGTSVAGDSLIRGGRGTGGAGNLDANVAFHEAPAGGGIWESGEEIIFINDAVTAPTAAGTGGAFLWSEGALLNAYAWATPAAGFARIGLIAGSGAGSAAATGGLRLQGNGATQGRIVFRNPGDTGDYGGLSADGATLVHLGGPYPTRPPSIVIDPVSSTVIRINGAAMMAVYTNRVELSNAAVTFRWAAAVVAPLITHAADATAGVTGDDLTVEAQGVSDPAGNADAGDFGVTGGKGTVHANNLDGNVWVHTAPASWQAMEMGIFEAEAVSIPTGNPVAGVYRYTEGGAAKVRGTGGTITTYGPAEPHCPKCGRDCAHQWANPEAGWELEVCMWCLTDALGDAGVMTKTQK